MEIKVLASSSEGNAYIINDGITRLLIDCGIPLKEILQKTNFVLPDACLVSHSHGDHAKSFVEVTRRGVMCYLSPATFIEIGSPKTPFCARLEHDIKRQIGTYIVLPLKMEHDVPCLGFYIYSTMTFESLFFATDTCCIPYKLPPMDYIMVEANYDIDILNDRIMQGYVDPVIKNRLARSHMEIGATIDWLKKQDLRKAKRIYLLHLSHGSSNADEFKRRVEECTGVPCTIA